MKYELRSRGVRLTRQLEQHIERRVRYAAHRFGSQIRSLRVHLSDVNGPKGGKDDIHCRLQAQLAPRGSVLIEERRGDPFAAVARAADRAGHAFSRASERLRSRRRGRRERER